jgi:TonB family protein
MKYMWLLSIVATLLTTSGICTAQEPNGGKADLTQSPPKADTAPRAQLSKGDAQALLIKSSKPDYPPLAPRVGIQGDVVMKALVDRDGNVVDVIYVSGHPMLAPAAVTAVKQWKYKPYVADGKPQPFETQITMNFKLPDRISIK